MTSQDRHIIKSIEGIIYNEFGIHISERKQYSLLHRLDQIMLHENFSSLEDFYNKLAGGDKKCLETLARYITTNHTYFFRESDHFNKLVEYIKASRSIDTTIWCAASSTGEEPYSIAITLLDAGIKNFRILASDIDISVLNVFNKGVYTSDHLEKITKKQRLTYFIKKSDNEYKVCPEVRNHIAIKRLNLMDDLHFENPFNYIFCRNVFIYFDEASRNDALLMLINNLSLNGKLFIGHTETLFTTPRSLKKEGHSIYKRIF